MKDKYLIPLLISVLLIVISIPVLTKSALDSYTQAVRGTEYERGWIKGYKSASMFYNSNSKISKIPPIEPPLIIQDMYNFKKGYYYGFKKRINEE